MTKKELFPPKEVDQYVSKAIVDIIEAFIEINPTLNYGHKGQRAAAETLFKQFGEAALRMAKYAVQIQGQPFSPTITSPMALVNKIGDLMVYHKRNTTGNTVNIK